MSASSTLVNVTEDAELRLVKLLAESAPVSSNFVASCEQCIVHGDASALLKTIVSDPSATGGLLLMDLSEAVSAFSVLCALLERVRTDEPQEEAGLAKALADAVMPGQLNNGDKSTKVVERRITLLSTLYNSRSNGSEKCGLLARMIQLAGQFKVNSMLTENEPLGRLLGRATSSSSILSKPRIVGILDSWEVPLEDRRDLYKAAATYCLEESSKQRFTLLLVETYSDSVDADGLAAAKSAAIGAIKDPFTLFSQQRMILTQPAIQALANDASTKPLFGLLKVFQEEKVEDYSKFLVAHGGEKCLSVYGLSADECRNNMRSLSLCSLAAEHEEIPYSSIAKTLQVPESEVESWVIAAVSSGVLSAKMDQLQGHVIVERASVRKFDMDSWKSLKSQLDQWKANVRGILDAFQENQAIISQRAQAS